MNKNKEANNKVCVNCIRWEGKHFMEYAHCWQLLMKTPRLHTCRFFIERTKYEQQTKNLQTL